METQHKQTKPEKEADGNSELTRSEKINLGSNEIANRIRSYLKEKYKGFKFSVVQDHYSMGWSICIALMESPIKVIKDFDEVRNDEVQRLIDRGFYTEEQIKEQQGKRYHQLNQFVLRDEFSESWNNGVFLTEEAHNILQDVVKFADQFNWNNSDAMTDYYDVNFSLSVHIGKWDKDFKQPENLPKQPKKTYWLVDLTIEAKDREEVEQILGEKLNSQVSLIKDTGQEV